MLGATSAGLTDDPRPVVVDPHQKFMLLVHKAHACHVDRGVVWAGLQDLCCHLCSEDKGFIIRCGSHTSVATLKAYDGKYLVEG